MEHLFDTKVMPELVLENEFVSITFFEAESLILLKWKRQIDFGERKEIFLWAYQFSKDRKVKNWLIDDEEIYIITTEERSWVENEWTEIVADSGIEKIAVYVPEEAYSVINTNTDFTKNAQHNYKQHGITEHEVFTDYGVALMWLRS
ncbi:hypothetical protein [Pontibacter burrus]|uniref:STAS/SEC14 domain-containing protein n=1 Tax=Pontibacter burrus TaxID=2704466 RepID=A0A6B3LSZ5_9BACT|nr:hypothetical protein [Pontibacter burrus]NEM97128.1 hypothetical protein [Pontibacter burrus]